MLTKSIELNYAEITDTNTSNVRYFCRARKLGSSASSAVWQCRKETTAANVVTRQRADGDDNYDNVAANIASLTYS